MKWVRSSPDRGASAVEYAAVVVLVAALLGGLVVALNSGGGLNAGVAKAVCVLSGDGGECKPQSGEGFDGDGVTPTARRTKSEPRLPSPTPGPRPTPDDPDKEVREETEAVLDETDIGREYREYLKNNPIDLTWEDGEGGYWNGDKVQIDGSWSPEDRAATFIHELTHDRLGRPDPGDFDSKEKYREAMADYEVQSMLKEIEMYRQLEEARGDDFEKSQRQRYYESLYKDDADKARKDTYEEQYDRILRESMESGYYDRDPEEAKRVAKRQAEAAAEQAAEDATYDALMDDFLSGRATGSNSGKPYIDVWDERYDDAHCGGFLWHECW